MINLSTLIKTYGYLFILSTVGWGKSRAPQHKTSQTSDLMVLDWIGIKF